MRSQGNLDRSGQNIAPSWTEHTRTPLQTSTSCPPCGVRPPGATPTPPGLQLWFQTTSSHQFTAIHKLPPFWRHFHKKSSGLFQSKMPFSLQYLWVSSPFNVCKMALSFWLGPYCFMCYWWRFWVLPYFSHNALVFIERFCIVSDLGNAYVKL